MNCMSALLGASVGRLPARGDSAVQGSSEIEVRGAKANEADKE